jgi:hypothetical protein
MVLKFFRLALALNREPHKRTNVKSCKRCMLQGLESVYKPDCKAVDPENKVPNQIGKY